MKTVKVKIDSWHGKFVRDANRDTQHTTCSYLRTLIWEMLKFALTVLFTGAVCIIVCYGVLAILYGFFTSGYQYFTLGWKHMSYDMQMTLLLTGIIVGSLTGTALVVRFHFWYCDWSRSRRYVEPKELGPLGEIVSDWKSKICRKIEWS